MSLIDIHKRVFEYLYDKYQNNGMFFMPRVKNYKSRLEKGYYFIGDDNYLQISFWDSRDWKEKIHNIAFVILDNGYSYIEISGRDNDTKANMLRSLVEVLSSFSNLSFTELYKNKWKAEYSDDNYVENLESFILNEKGIIDEYLRKHGEGLINFIGKEKFDRITERIFSISKSLKEESRKRKKEGYNLIKKSEYTMNFFHNKLQNSIYNCMKKSDEFEAVHMEVNYVDLVTIDIEGKKSFYELKPTNAKNAIREAIGQLLEYSHYSSNDKADNLIVLSYKEPTENDIRYLNTLREKYRLPIYYRYYDIESKQLSIKY